MTKNYKIGFGRRSSAWEVSNEILKNQKQFWNSSHLRSKLEIINRRFYSTEVISRFSGGLKLSRQDLHKILQIFLGLTVTNGLFDTTIFFLKIYPAVSTFKNLYGRFSCLIPCHTENHLTFGSEYPMFIFWWTRP